MSNEELVKQIQQGINPGDNMELLYTQNFNLLRIIARRYAFNGDLDDLLQEAYFGLYEAVQRYEDTAGVLFMSYAIYWIKQSIWRYLENNGRSIRLPAAMQGKLLLYKKLISAYEMQLGRKPTDYELCRHMRVNSKILLEIKKACQTDNIQSLDECVPGADEVLLEECIPDPDIDIENNVIDNMIERGKRTELWQIVKDNTSPEENTVITARYRKGLSMEVAGRLIGISRDTARNIEAKALRKLRRSRITRLLEEKFEVNYARGYRGSFSRFRDAYTSIVEEIAIRNLENMRGESCTGTMNIT